MSGTRISRILGRTELLLVLASLFAAAANSAPSSIAHRGNSMFAPENTLASFRSALAVADMVEFDVQVTRDGQLVVMHDDTADRTTDGTGAIDRLTLAQLRAFDAGAWFSKNYLGERVPTMAEAILTITPRSTALIERKHGDPEAYVSEFRWLGTRTNVILYSFNWDFLSKVHTLDPTIRLAAIGSGPLTAATLTTITNTGSRIVMWNDGNVSAAEVALTHKAGLSLYVYTVNDEAILKFVDMGVDGIITDDPASVRAWTAPDAGVPVQLSDGLIAYWTLDDGLTDPLTTSVRDWKGTSQALLLRKDGQFQWLDRPISKFGGCLRVDGTNSYVAIPQNAFLDLSTNEMSISLWVQLSQLPSQISTEFSGIFDSVEDSYVLYLARATKELRFKITDTRGDAARPGIAEADLGTNQWLHVVGTFQSRAGTAAGKARIYLNGQLRDTHSGSDATAPVGLTGRVKPGQSATLGREGVSAANPFSGSVDDIAIWSRALSESEVARIYNYGIAGLSLSNLVTQTGPIIEVTSIQRPARGSQLQIEFQSRGSAPGFWLLKAADPEGPYTKVPELVPAPLGEGRFRFDLPIEIHGAGWFRIEAR